MVRRIALLLAGIVSLLATPAAAQFGVPKKKQGGSFEELNEAAKKQQQDGGAGMNLDALAGMDPSAMQKMMEEAMADPALREQMEAMNANIGDAMEQLSKMSPEELQKQMMEGLQQLTSGDIMDSIIGKKDEVLETLAAQGLVPADKIEEYRANPEKFEEEMKDAFSQMQKVFEDPEMLSAATEMMKGMGDVMQNPEMAMKEMLGANKGLLEEFLGDDTKIEEARLELLKNPDQAGNPLLAELFKGEDIKEILYDSEKWKAAVKEGQEMLLGGGAAGGAGANARVGEL